jgi:hypothetical protein
MDTRANYRLPKHTPRLRRVLAKCHQVCTRNISSIFDLLFGSGKLVENWLEIFFPWVWSTETKKLKWHVTTRASRKSRNKIPSFPNNFQCNSIQ